MAGYMRSLFVLIVATAILGLAIDSQAASRIYKSVDAEGNVVFTDIPPKEGESGEAVSVETPNTFQPAEPENREQWIVEPTEEDSEPESFNYSSLNITTPANDEAIRENAGNVNVVIDVTPELRTGHQLRVLMDGKPEQAGTKSVYMLPNVDRGTHTLTAEVIDDTGKVLITSNPVTFTLQRVAAARQPRPSN